MSKIPFDIKFRPQIESGEYKVVNRIGEEVRIICWDWPDEDCPIVAFDGDRMPSTWGKDGRFMSWRESDSDLFIITPERELSEFEKKLSDIVGYAISMSVSEPKKPTDEFVREYAPQLLSLARKQLQPEIDEAYKTADEVMYRKGKEDGIVEARNDITARIIALKQAKDRAEEALKDLPRWKRAKEYMELGPNDFVFTLDSNGKCSPYWDTEVEKGQFYITESDIENLPKEDEK